ncbi:MULTISPECIES: disulfide bond formation protein B [Pseudovibrio]|uniref:disulfide bond formation protein B n=1 Tax=Stappiaceae TaxID=2821832 RepID=UPI0023653A4B|nr:MULTISPECIES: disulfide bond formation protein B [Pseudovibrio]MDD7909329.1 disulfide bond formation protein B [Pseudovibrio exalbescens]MDX5594889.1 disulfide bond formation protein B [Pseudovibrio sp. SPO723]
MEFVSRSFMVALTYPKRVSAALVAFGSILALAMAWSFQLAGYLPCQLCLAQRVPYYIAAVLALAALGFAFTERFRWMTSLLLLVCAGLFVYGGGIGIYQAGAEWEFWLGPNDCGGPVSSINDASNMLTALSETRVVSCSVPAIRILGLSFAGLNTLYSIGITFVALCGVLLSPRKAG